MTEELDRQILDAKEKFETFATVPSIILITSYLALCPLYVNLFIQLGKITKYEGVAIIVGVELFYFICAKLMDMKAKKELRKLLQEEKERFSPMKKQYIGDRKNRKQSYFVDQLLKDAHIFAYKEHISKILKEEIEIKVCGPAAYTIFYSLVAIMITFIIPESKTDTSSYVSEAEMLPTLAIIIITLVISMVVFFIKDRKRTNIKNYLVDLYQRRYEITNFIC